MKTIIHINKNLKQSNDKHGRTLPVCRVEVEGQTWYGSSCRYTWTKFYDILTRQT